MSAVAGRHAIRRFEAGLEVTQAITSVRIARAKTLKHWRHRRHMTADERFGWQVLAAAVVTVGLLAAFVSGWS